MYSLGMTLFHLLTNTLSKKGFGVKEKDVRMINPQVSPSVARALEKATALEPEMRYANVAAFRLALCGASFFCFETGETATEPQELAELCACYPEEASEYLANGESESWLEDIGEADLARATRRIGAMYIDPLESVEQFLHVVVGPNARMRGEAILSTNGYSTNGEKDREVGTALLDHVMAYRESLPRIFMANRRSSIQISPRRLDFGPVYPPGLSGPLAITIRGYQGLRVSGAITPSEPWIQVERTEFDGMNTSVNVRIHSRHLQSYTHYQAFIVISRYEENEQDIVVTVDADIQGYSTLAGRRRPGKTVTPDEDDEDDSEFVIPTLIQSGGHQLVLESIIDQDEADDDQVMKYVPSDGQDCWEPCPASPEQLRYQRLGLAFSTALMLRSLSYISLSRLPSPLLPPNPCFILFLPALIPATTLRALLLYPFHASIPPTTLPRLITSTAPPLAVIT